MSFTRNDGDDEESQARAAVAAAIALHPSLHPGDEHNGNGGHAHTLADVHTTHDVDVSMDSHQSHDDDDDDQDYSGTFIPDLSGVVGGGVGGVGDESGDVEMDMRGMMDDQDGEMGSVGVIGRAGMSEEEIRRKQNRSRAGGRVLPRGAACEFCKRRKLKCDASKPQCNHCQKSNRECVYNQRKQKSRVKLLEDKLAELQQKLQHEVAAAASEGSPAPSNIQSANHATGPSSNQGQVHGELFPLPIIASDKLDSLSLPPMQIDPVLLPKQGEGVEEGGEGEEGQEGFDAIHNYLTNHAQAAAAEAGVEALAEASAQGGQVFGFALDDGREGEGSSGSVPPQGQGTSGSTTRYLMTLANAAEAASDGPGTNQTIANEVLNHERQRAVAALTRASDGLTGDILEDIETRFSGAREDAGRVGDQFVNALIDTFLSRANHFRYTRSIDRFRESLLQPTTTRPLKPLLYSILAAVSVLPPNLISKQLPPGTENLITMLAPLFVQLAQREIVGAIARSDRLLDCVQACALLAHLHYAQGKINEGWLMATQGMNVAVGCGLHRLDVTQTEGTSRSRLESLMREVRAKAALLAPTGDLMEIGERVHLFWTIYFYERTGSLNLGWQSSISDMDITTPLPRPIEEYAGLSATELYTSMLSDVLAPTSSTQAPMRVDTGLILTLKSLALLQRVYGLFDLPPSNDAALESANIQASYEYFHSTLPEDFSHPPSVGRYRKAYQPDAVWLWTAHYTIKVLFAAYKAITSPASTFDNETEVDQSIAIQESEHVGKLAKVVLTPDVNKSPVVHLALIWPITTRFLLKQSNTQWSLGRTERSKELTDLAAPFLESLRTIGKVYPVGNMQASKLELLRSGGNEYKDGEFERQG